LVDDCNRGPSFNLPGEKKGIYCSEHRLKDMINVKQKACLQDNCAKQPCCNYPDQKERLYCAEHKLPGMVNVLTKPCDHCPKKPTYGYPGHPPRFCKPHHPDGTIKKSLRKCQSDECKEYATHGPSRDNPTKCEDHAAPTDSCLVERECSQCKRIDVLTKANICVNFCAMEKEHKALKKQVKQKEEAIGRLLKDRIALDLFSEDKVVDIDCSRRRPDFVYHLGTHVLIIEVDEGQHKSYACTAYGDDKTGRVKGENIRMFQIAQSFDGLPVLFLRYNPDAYKGVKVIEVERRETLVRWIKACLVYEEWMVGIQVKYLFYDQYDPTCMAWTTVSEQDVI